MIQRLSLTAAILVLAACTQEGTVTDPAPAPEVVAETVDERADSFAKIMADHWALRLEENPVLAEQLGHPEGRGRLSDPSLEGYWAGVEARRALLERMDAIDGESLEGDESINYRLLRRELEDAVEAAEHPGRYLTMTTYSAPHLSLARVAERANLRRDEDVASYLGRLEAMPGYMEAVIARLAEAVDQGWTQPCQAMVGFERTYESHIVDDIDASVFMQPLLDNPRVTDGQREQARQVIRDGIIRAFRDFKEFYEGTYKPACRSEAGVGSLDGGQDFYAYRARSYTTTDMTPEQIHQIGLSEVARIRSEMEDVAREAGFDSLAAFQNHLRTDPKYYPKTGEERIAVASTIAKRMDGQLVNLFTLLPRMPYDIRPIPLDVAEGTTTAYYSGPAADGTRAGTYWLNTTKLDSRPLYELESLTLHEAVPGHHLQIALSQELDLPEFRRFGGFTAFTEGWGLYSERLGMEVGFYDTPETNFGRLSYEMWRACRLVVDTGMHAKGWTRQEAIDFMLENTGLSEVNIIREVDRYITWPGQALAYKIGELKIRELRERAESRLGDDFDVRLFHDEILGNGALPLSILEEQIDAWITEQEESLGRN
ncbi:DUF885 domain-containing protein [Parvularcula lutaonensis]|uniref:DUF885 domain-containing protein n=1 Tax=Parvularcula lutaonensis TaxID=491923 RepID=A0ABV7MCL9_9PROT|nr:DUF885 domain-containing protein [Parvularcula lutaonensis]GGY47019.1 hypothetical protein GCM10007148_15310 [Parvularcula lutaonensis]